MDYPAENELYDSENVIHSWKSIAKFLSRSVRTVRRWEENENLPIRRHKHIKSNTVFAYTSELKAWLMKREVPNPKLDVIKEAQTSQQSKKTWLRALKWF